MVTPVVENVNLLIDHLDFDIPCMGKRISPTEIIPCSIPAKFYFSHACGCQSFKCTEHKIQWQIHQAAQIARGAKQVRCTKCGKHRSIFESNIRPI